MGSNSWKKSRNFYSNVEEELVEWIYWLYRTTIKFSVSNFPCLQLSFVIILLLEINCNNCYTNSLLIFDNYLDWYNLFSIFITNLLLKVQLGASISLYQFLDYFEMNLLIWNYYLNYLLTKSVLTCLIGSTSKKIYKI